MSRPQSLLSQIALSLLVALAFAATASAQATRTWVAAFGDDINPCSRTAPCKTFAGAISKTAAGGEISVIDSAGYGPVVITKSITIDGAGAQASILSAGTNGIVVNALATDVVTIRNLSINGVGTGANGIRFLAGAALHVENVTIFDFLQRGIDFQPSGNASLFVRESQISDNNAPVNGGGILIKPGAFSTVLASIVDTRLDRNFFGLRAEDRSTVTVSRTTAVENTNNGFQAFSAAGQPVSLTLENCVASSNTGNGIQSNGAASTVRISNVTVTGNGQGLATPGGTLISFGNNLIDGNPSVGAPMNGAPTQTVSLQ